MSAHDFSVADVLAWARTKPADERYDYSSNENCAMCQFLRETGRAANPTVGDISWNDWEKGPYQGAQLVDSRPFPSDLRLALVQFTFGELVERLEALAPETVITKTDWARLDAYLTDIERVPA